MNRDLRFFQKLPGSYLMRLGDVPPLDWEVRRRPQDPWEPHRAAEPRTPRWYHRELIVEARPRNEGTPVPARPDPGMPDLGWVRNPFNRKPGRLRER